MVHSRSVSTEEEYDVLSTSRDYLHPLVLIGKTRDLTLKCKNFCSVDGSLIWHCHESSFGSTLPKDTPSRRQFTFTNNTFCNSFWVLWDPVIHYTFRLFLLRSHLRCRVGRNRKNEDKKRPILSGVNSSNGPTGIQHEVYMGRTISEGRLVTRYHTRRTRYFYYTPTKTFVKTQ